MHNSWSVLWRFGVPSVEIVMICDSPKIQKGTREWVPFDYLGCHWAIAALLF